MDASTSSNANLGFGLGLGLGLPTSLMQERRSQHLSAKHEDHYSQNTLLFIMPSGSRRVSSVSTQGQGGLVSYWSPATEVNVSEFEDNESDEDDDTDEESDEADLSPRELQSLDLGKISLLDRIESMSPISLVPHSGLHALSPKLGALARASANPGEVAEEAISNALEWAWLVPMVGEFPFKQFCLKNRNNTNNVLTWLIDATIPPTIQGPQPNTSETQQSSGTSKAALIAPTMTHMPSIASICSELSFGSSAADSAPSVVTSSYQSDMLRSHSLLSSFSLESMSTTATSAIASTSQSVMQRKRPVTSRAKIASSAESNVIKLAGRRCCEMQRGESSSASYLIRKNTKASIISCKASIHSASPNIDDIDDMVFAPMHQLPSPHLSHSELSDGEQWRSHSDNEDYNVTDLSMPANHGCTALIELWQEAEAAERSRRVLKKAQRAMPSRSAKMDVQTPNIRSWMSRVKKSASFGNLKNRAVEQEQAVLDTADLEQALQCVDVEAAVQAFLEPRMSSNKLPSIEQVMSCKNEASHQFRLPAGTNALWEFLG